MIKISKDNIPSRILSMAIGLFPAYIALVYAYSQREDMTSLLVSTFIIIILLWLNIILNFMDYEVFFDYNTQEFIFKRFKKEWRFKEYKNFKIVPYSMFISFGFQYYKFQIEDKTFRFRYKYDPRGYHFLINLSEISENIRIDILSQINNE